MGRGNPFSGYCLIVSMIHRKDLELPRFACQALHFKVSSKCREHKGNIEPLCFMLEVCAATSQLAHAEAEKPSTVHSGSFTFFQWEAQEHRRLSKKVFLDLLKRNQSKARKQSPSGPGFTPQS